MATVEGDDRRGRRGRHRRRGIAWRFASSRAFHLAFAAALVVAVVPFGSTGQFAGYVAPFATALLALASVLFLPKSDRTRWIERAAWLLALCLAAYTGLQVTGFAGFLPAHPIWARAGEALGEPLPGVPAIDPAASVAALPAVLAPFLMFVACLRIARDERAGLALLQTVGILGGLVALAGLAQFAFAPDFLLLAEKSAYLDSFTGVFVNRNTTATYLGCTTLVLFALLQWELRHSSNMISTLSTVIEPSDRRRSHKPILYVGLIAVCVLALLLTKSRAGIVCSSVAIFVQICLAARTYRSLLGWLATAAGAALAIATALVVFGGQAIYRAEVRGINDDRFCVLPGIWKAARDNFPVGSGLGSFRLVFQAYRDPACGIYGTWRRAHNFFLEGGIALGAVFWIACGICVGVLTAVYLRGFWRRRRYRSVPILGLSLMLLLIAHDLIDFSLQIPGMALTAAAVLGLCVSVSLGRSGAAEGRPGTYRTHPDDRPEFPLGRPAH